ncbi:hypothetical protein D3C77_615770 [compost metagenome]
MPFSLTINRVAALHSTKIGSGLPNPGKSRLIIAKDQHVALSTVLEVKVDTFFFAQALNKVQIRFIVLDAVVTLGIGRP